MLRTDKNIYLAGETVRLRLARITDYPFGVVSGFALVRQGHVVRRFSLNGDSSACLAVRDPRDKALRWTLPEDVRADEPLRIRLDFCDKRLAHMPERVESNPIVVR